EKLEKELAGGRVWTGRQAKAAGLIDELGTLEDAIAAAKKMGGLPENSDPELLILPKPRTFLETLMESRSDTQLAAPAVRGVPVVRERPGLGEHLGDLESMLRLRDERVWLVLPYRVKVK